VLADIVEAVKRAPSSMNTQPEHTHPLTVPALDEVQSRNMAEISTTKPKRNTPSSDQYVGKHQLRQSSVDKTIFVAQRNEL